MQYSSSILAFAGLLTTVVAHGSITSPTPRNVGEGYKSTCGTQVYYNQASDRNGNVQGVAQVARSQTDVTAECNLWLCKGFVLADNTANVQSYTAGQVVPMTFNVAAPHTGTANVSIVDTATNSIIGSPLLTYAEFASTAVGVKAAETSFSITIPADLGSKCAVAGACVIQHWWDARSIDQTYESCIDFTVGGSGAAAPVASSSAAAPVASSSAAAPVASSSVAPVVQASTSSAAAQITTSAAVPTTLQTMVKPSSTAAATTEAAAPVATSAPADEYEDCE